MKLDVTSEAEWDAAVKAAVGAFGKLDVLVNNAGISGTYDTDMLSSAAWDKVMAVNAKGVFLGMKAAIPLMKKAGGGAIVNISSISGFVGQDGVHMAYNASKGAVRIMTKTAAVQLAGDGIRVNSVHPGFMPPMRTSIMTRSGFSLGTSFRPSSPLEAVVSSISGEAKIRWNEYCTSASSSINNSLLIQPSDN